MLKLASAIAAIALLLAPQAKLDNRAAVTYFIEDGKGIPGYRDSDRELATMAVNAWSRESNGKLKFAEVKSPDAALVRFRWISPTGGLYGEMERITVNGKVGAIVNVMPNVSVQGEPIAGRAAQDALLRETIVYLTCVHELGHAVGLRHTDQFADIMYYFGYGGDIVNYFMRYRTKLQTRADISKYSGLSAADVEELRRIYAN